MKIAWINELAHPAGGAERYVRDTARELADQGVRSVLFYDVKATPDPSPSMLAPFEGGFPIVDLGRQLRELAPDVVYVHRLHENKALRALAASPFPVVRFFHDHRLFCLREHKYTALSKTPCCRAVGAGCYPCLGFVRRSETWPGVELASLRRLRAEQEQARHHTAFIVGSRYMANHVVAHGFERSRIHVIPLYASVPPRLRVHGQRQEDLLLFIGQLTTGKGLDVLLQALPRTVRPCRLIVVGRGRQEVKLRALVQALGLAERVAFMGWLDPEALSAHYQQASCLVFPTRAPETSGLVGIEAMAHGTPVIASPLGGIEEWLSHGRTGLSVPPNDPAALAAAIDQLLGDPSLRSQMGLNALQTFEERFRPEHHADRLLTVLEAAAGAGRLFG
ncbi:glycosyltransferase family 4 protein [Hyalangium sp.]|uniref:glycosyltransferase family 4 protein n=1 Tax=Hyalangium sp. TaxID=2028555 RepID=UPI002D2A6792|nr:glycosyltransferase family 4 protein [Hyalangium sp.]HYI01100.1 glycosyltransferase family 4 protein [Hyalangium sp.]